MATHKRIVVISDPHCGHLFGLIPPGYEINRLPGHNDEGGDPYGFREKSAVVAPLMWEWFASATDALKPIDACVLNGDAVDGDGAKSGGTELITTDRNVQAEMAAKVLEHVDAKTTLMTLGTPYHTGVKADDELMVCDKFKKGVDAIRDQLFIDVNGLIFDIKHDIGRSSVPYGKHTQPTKHKILNILAAEEGREPRARITVRSHIHEYAFSERSNGAELTTAGLQAWTKFGARRVTGTIDIGISWFDVYGPDEWHHGKHFLELECLRPQPIHV